MNKLPLFLEQSCRSNAKTDLKWVQTGGHHLPVVIFQNGLKVIIDMYNSQSTTT